MFFKICFYSSVKTMCQAIELNSHRRCLASNIDSSQLPGTLETPPWSSRSIQIMTIITISVLYHPTSITIDIVFYEMCSLPVVDTFSTVLAIWARLKVVPFSLETARASARHVGWCSRSSNGCRVNGWNRHPGGDRAAKGRTSVSGGSAKK